jgi:hypothetical protein
MNKADVYRKAAEVIGRDGWNQGGLFAWDPDIDGPVRYEELVKNQSLAVCALGACARAQYELYGTIPEDAYETYEFLVETPSTGALATIWMMNDLPRTSAEDVILAMENHAEEIDK